MSRNFGVGSRDMKRAGCMVWRASSASFASVSTNSSHWRAFTNWAKTNGLSKMEKICATDIVAFGEYLAARVKDGTLALATAHTRISVVNRTFELVRGDKKVRACAVRDCGLPRRSNITKTSKSMPVEKHQMLCNSLPGLISALLNLQRLLGLRFKESALLNARAALKNAQKFGWVLIMRGTKGGRARKVPITTVEQMEALEHAASIQDGRSLIPKKLSYAQFRRACYRQFSHFHSERHAYAQARYQSLTNAPCPVVAGKKHGKDHLQFLSQTLAISIEEARHTDDVARKQVSRELGHRRKGITNAYYG